MNIQLISYFLIIKIIFLTSTVRAEVLKSQSVKITVTNISSGAIEFPLHTESGKRYLLDNKNQPFLMYGDTAWSLEVNLSKADVVKYLDDRKQKGFNTVLIELIEYCFTIDSVGFSCGTPGKNYYGDYPFTKKASGVFDFTKPVEAYWLHVDYVISQAKQRNMLVLATPAYVGYQGGDQGWYKEMVANGNTALNTYGQFVGNRYKNFNNILWVEGGDYNVPDKSVVRAVVDGIKSVLPTSLHTYHGVRFSPSSDVMAGEPWLNVNTVYTDSAVAVNKSSSCFNPSTGCGAIDVYKKTSIPFFFIEGTYEGEGSDGQTTRSQAYQAILSGATGQLMGNAPIWYFNSGWQAAMNSEGSKSMSTLTKIFTPLKWWLLTPDMNNELLPQQTDRVSYPAAFASDGSFAMIYFSSGSVVINLKKLTPDSVTATWIDPYSGAMTAALGSPFTVKSNTTFQKQDSNSAGDRDWILLLK